MDQNNFYKHVKTCSKLSEVVQTYLGLIKTKNTHFAGSYILTKHVFCPISLYIVIVVEFCWNFKGKNTICPKGVKIRIFPF